MNAPLVSIVIPCFNSESVVADAIRSALAQTYAEKEVIVVDDGSTDGSVSVLKSFGDAVRWETGPNRGGCAARNRGVAIARGEFIQFLDSDDLLLPQKLERQVAAAQQHPEQITYSDYEQHRMGDGKPLFIHARECRGIDPVVFVLRSQRLNTAAPLHRREWLESVGGFRKGLSCAQEYDLHLRLTCMGRTFVRVPEPLFILRSRPGSVSSNSLRVLDQHAEIVRNVRDLLVGQGGLTTERQEALATLLAIDARTYLRHGRRESADQYFALAREVHPSGGIDGAYGRFTRTLRTVIGAAPTERIVMLKRKLLRQSGTL